MPTYQYACPDCGHEFELRQKFTDDPVKRCPKCERRHVYRVIHQVAVTFKGSGWYINDSKGSDIKKVEHKSEPPAAEKSGEPSSSPPEGDKKSEAEGKSKSETKSEPKSASAPGAGKK